MPLKGIKVLELAGLAPAPFLGLMLSDFGAKVIRVDNLQASNGIMFSQQKSSIYLNLKHEKGRDIFRRLSLKTDVLIEPFRPGVMERLGLGPDKLCQENPSLIYTRLSGFGQDGPLSSKGNHDINFLSISGIMSRLGSSDKPPSAPLNLLGDFASGSTLGAFAIMLALYERTKSGQGQVIDHSMTEGIGYISSFFWESMEKNRDFIWPNWPKRGENLLDYGAPFYRCYECSDGKFLAVGALEEKFYSQFIKTLGFDEEMYNRYDVSLWPQMAEEFAKVIRSKTRDEWVDIFDKVDACVTPVLQMDEVHRFEHNRIRHAFDPECGYPNPAPKLSRTPATGQRKNFLKQDGQVESQTRTILKEELGFTDEDIEQLEQDIVN